MLNWTRYQERTNGIHNKYEKVKLTPEFHHACAKVMDHVIKNNMEFKPRPLMPHDYAETILNNAERFNYKLKDKKVVGWLNDSKYLRSMSLPVRILYDRDLPEDLVKETKSALEKQENVYRHAIYFNVIKMEPGDQIMLHYDPKSLYLPAWPIGNELPGQGTEYIDMRAFVYMNDRQPGQVSWLGKSDIDYKAYDMFKFEVDKVYHGTANFGYDDRYMICFSWAEPLG